MISAPVVRIGFRANGTSARAGTTTKRRSHSRELDKSEAPSALAPFTWGWSNFGWSETTDQKNGHPPLAPKWLLASPRFPARARIALESDKKPFFDSTTPVIWSPVRSSGHWTSLDR